MAQKVIGETPAGGTYSIAVGFDATGIEVDELNDASFIVITEYDADDNVLLRTTAGNIIDNKEDLDRISHTLEGDDSIDPDSTDMGKDTWDLRHHRDMKPVDNMADLMEVMQWDVEEPMMQRNLLANLTVQPVWNSAPAALKAEVDSFLGT